jgi:hypothetical protein
VSTDLLPERILLDLLNMGVDAITATPTLLNTILRTLDDTELAKARDYWADHPPRIIQNFARHDDALPIYALTMTGDDPLQDYIGMGEEALLNELDETEGGLYKRRVTGKFTIYVYAQHPDVCMWYYRVLRRICNVGIKYLIDQGLDDPTLSGADLAPDPRYTPDDIFVRRLTISVEYMEQWTDQDELWLAMNGDPPDRLSADGSIHVYHKDTVVNGVRGGVVPISDPD